MRAFAIFTGLIALGLAGIAFLGYPAWLVMAPWLDNPKFHRIASRVGMLLLTIGFVIVVRRLKMADRQSLGFGLPARKFVAEVFKALLLGMRADDAGAHDDAAARHARTRRRAAECAAVGAAALGAVITGLTVALIEETFLRGAMQFAITRESGARVAIVLTSLVYAATHFIGRYRVKAADVHAGSGIDMLALHAGAISRGHCTSSTPSCVWWRSAILLGMARVYTGNIAASIGLHAGWVAVIYVVKETSKREMDSPLRWMLSEADGFVGWMVLAWTLAIGVAMYFLVRACGRNEPFP